MRTIIRTSRSFDPRPRVGDDPPIGSWSRRRICFDPRPRVGDDTVTPSIAVPIGCFDPRPRVGDDGENRAQRESGEVSIHAPAWGTTPDLERQVIVRRVSIHAPAWGTTVARPVTTSLMLFRSTPPRGGRRDF